MAEVKAATASAAAAAVITVVFLTFLGVSYFLSVLLGLPFTLNLPIAARLVGGAIALTGMYMAAWMVKHRGPVNVIVSTHVTFTKLFRRIPVAEKGGRTEPLVVTGPQKYVRNPLYLGIVAMALGFAILGGYTFVFIATIIILLWFGFVIIPFEERELCVLFGEQWKRYAEETPTLIPFTKRKKHVHPPSS